MCRYKGYNENGDPEDSECDFETDESYRADVGLGDLSYEEMLLHFTKIPATSWMHCEPGSNVKGFDGREFRVYTEQYVHSDPETSTTYFICTECFPRLLLLRLKHEQLED